MDAIHGFARALMGSFAGQKKGKSALGMRQRASEELIQFPPEMDEN